MRAVTRRWVRGVILLIFMLSISVVTIFNGITEVGILGGLRLGGRVCVVAILTRTTVTAAQVVVRSCCHTGENALAACHAIPGDNLPAAWRGDAGGGGGG